MNHRATTPKNSSQNEEEEYVEEGVAAITGSVGFSAGTVGDILLETAAVLKKAEIMYNGLSYGERAAMSGLVYEVKKASGAFLPVRKMKFGFQGKINANRPRKKNKSK